MMTMTLPVRLFAEALGTALLVATVIGSGLMAVGLSRDVGVQLAANAAATGAILVVLITVLGPVSGAHFNPVVTLVFVIRGEMPSRDLVPYVVAQCVGGVMGTIIAHLMFNLPMLGIGTTARSAPSLWFSEVVATFVLILAILGTLASRPDRVATTAALSIVAAYWFTASTSFANPAVTLARSFTDSFAGIAPAHALAFVIMQLIGALMALAASLLLFPAAKRP